MSRRVQAAIALVVKMHPAVFVLFVVVSKWQNVLSAPVPVRLVDLSHVFDNTTLNFPGLKPFQSRPFFSELAGASAKLEDYASSTHAGTHIDAPCHFAPGCGRVDEIPLEKLIAPAAVVDIRDKVAFNPEYELQIDDLLQWEDTTGRLLNDVILLVRSGWSKYWCNRAAFIGNPNNDADDMHFPGFATSALRWLVSKRNVYGIGMEPLTPHSEASKNAINHIIVNSKNIYILENMDDMDELPLFGATLNVMPMKIGGACGAPTRIVASIPHTKYKPRYERPSSYWWNT